MKTTTFFAITILVMQTFGSPFISSDRYNLKLLEAAPLLFEFHHLTTSEYSQKFHYPQRDSSWRENANAREKDALFRYQSERSFIAASVVGGVDYKGGDALNDTIWPGLDGGLLLRGFIDSVEFELDARIYSEGHSSKNPQSYDGEYMDYQAEVDNDGLEYLSYARYRGHLALNMGFARFDVGRDVMHWGPGYFNNLALNQFSLPFNALSIDFSIGPMSVYSFYGDLRIYKGNVTPKNKQKRNLYGHRYELNLKNLVLGISELQVIYNDDDVWLFVPIFPLFMEKGNYTESSNNGALSFDVNYRLFQKIRIYTEFFLDDLQSPVSLIENDNVQAKWAWMIGTQIADNFNFWGRLLEAGTVFEYARVEPYVYTHFVQNTAQFAHMEKPLGNPGGPNSQTIDWVIYSRYNRQWTMGIHQKWFWKGLDYGSALNDTTPVNHVKIKKEFLKGARMEYSISPMIAFEGQYVSFAMECSLINDEKIYTRLGFKW